MSYLKHVARKRVARKNAAHEHTVHRTLAPRGGPASSATRRVPRHLSIVAGLCLIVVPLSVAVPAAAAPTQSTTRVSGDNWVIEAAAGGFLVTLELDAALPMRSASPSLLADGVDLGPAIESADGRSLSLVTGDPAILRTTAITLGWDGAPDAQAGAQPRARALAAPPAARAMTTALEVDPAAPGAYGITRADYNLGDEAIDLAGIGGIKGELTGAVYLPEGKTTPSPVVLLLHGRHTSCAGSGANPNRWPCGPTQTNIPSYLGYDDTANALASNGFAVVSIAANAINANDNQLAADRGALARAQLVLDSLDLLARANAGTQPGLSPAITGRLDLGHVGLMGHSRGGDGVVRAALLNATRDKPYNIEAVLPLAPTDFGRMSLPDVPMAVILPYCDGDVSNLQGQHFIDDSRYAFGDSVLRSSVLVMGTNHNYFNTIWTPSIYPTSSSDDWAAQDRAQSNADCGSVGAPARLSATEQRNTGTAYMSAFFRLTLGDDQRFLPLFDGSATTATSAGRADVRVTAHQPAENRSDIARLTGSGGVSTAGAARAQVCASLSDRPIAGTAPYCVSTLLSAQVPHWTPATYAPSVAASPMLRFTWTAATGELRVPVPVGSRDASARTQLSFAVAPDENVIGSTDLTVRVLDGQGASQVLRVSEFDDALQVLPGTANPLRKVLLQNVLIPVSALTEVNVKDIREIRFGAGSVSGGVYLSDIAFTTPGVGSPKISDRPFASVADTIVEEGNGPSTVQAAVLLSRASSVPVIAELSGLGATGGRVGLSLDTVVFTPGETCKTITLPLYGDTAVGSAPSVSYPVVASVLQNATMGQTYAMITVREDDGVSGAQEPLRPVGVQGDACAEATAGEATLSISPAKPAPGESVTVSGTGFRTGESVALSLHSEPVELGSVIAAEGAIAHTITIPEGTEFGDHEIRAVGFGSALRSVGALAVVDPDAEPGETANSSTSGSADATGGSAAEANTNAETNADTGAGAEGSAASAGADATAGADAQAGAGADAQAGADSGEGTQASAASDAGAGTGTNPDTGTASGSGSSAEGPGGSGAQAGGSTATSVADTTGAKPGAEGPTPGSLSPTGFAGIGLLGLAALLIGAGVVFTAARRRSRIAEAVTPEIAD